MKKLLLTTTILTICFFLIGCTSNNHDQNSKSKPVDEIKKEIKNIDENIKYEIPLGIDSIKLMKSGKVILVTSSDKITEEETTVSLGVKEVYIYIFGNGGYRSVIFLKNDGTVSALNSSALIENNQIEVMDNLGGFTNVSYIKQVKTSDAFAVYVVLETGEEFMLDEYLK